MFHIFLILQSLPVKDKWECAYQTDPDTKVLIDRLSINAPLHESTILKISADYRTSIARNLLRLLEGRFLYYERIPTDTKHICRIIVPTSLCHTLFNLMHATPATGHKEEYKILYRIRLQFFGLGCVLLFLTGSKSVPIVCSCIIGGKGDKN